MKKVFAQIFKIAVIVLALVMTLKQLERLIPHCANYQKSLVDIMREM